MADYLLRVLLGAGINLALLLPFFALAYATTRPRPALNPLLWFGALFVIDMGLVFSFKLGMFVPAWGGFNWQGKLLETAWPVLLALTLPAFSAARVGLTLPADLRHWRTFGIACIGYALIGVPVMLAMGAHFSPSAPLPAWVYEGTMPGLGEEFVYRGVLLMLLNEAFGRPWKLAGIQLGWGFVIVTAMFGFLHGIDAKPGAVHIYWSAMIFPAITGAVLAWLRERTGSLWPGVLFHNVVNLLNTAFV